MKTITIGNREYPYFISAAAAKEYFTSLDKVDESDPLNIDKMIGVVHQGMKDASLTQSLWHRITNRVPSREKLSHMIDLSQARDVLNGLIPADPKAASEPESEESPLKGGKGGVKEKKK